MIERAAWCFIVLLGCVTISCQMARSPEGAGPAASSVLGEAQFGPADDRKISRSGELRIRVDSLEESQRAVERIVGESNGRIEQSRTTEGRQVLLRCRVPASRLEAVMDAITILGDVRNRAVASRDVTDEYFDLETRLKNAIALRDRLRALLEKASKVEEILAVEKELSRIQAELESMQGRLDRLRSEVEESTLSVTLERKRVLGPLGYLAYGIGWCVEKLFVLE
jgi:hypothetical protein